MFHQEIFTEFNFSLLQLGGLSVRSRTWKGIMVNHLNPQLMVFLNFSINYPVGKPFFLLWMYIEALWGWSTTYKQINSPFYGLLLSPPIPSKEDKLN